MQKERTPKRTKFLSILCALSAIFAIYGVLSGITNALSPPEIDDQYLENLFKQISNFNMPVDGLQEQAQNYYLNLMLNFGNYGVASFLFCSIQLIGVIMMYQLNRIGFVLYVLAQLGQVVSPAIFGGFNQFGKISLAIALAWSAVWVVLYATQLKYFKK